MPVKVISSNNTDVTSRCFIRNTGALLMINKSSLSMN